MAKGSTIRFYYMKLRDRTIADKILEYCGEIENILVRLNHAEPFH